MRCKSRFLPKPRLSHPKAFLPPTSPPSLFRVPSSSSSSLIPSLLHSRVNLEWCDKTLNLLLPRKSGTIKSLTTTINFGSSLGRRSLAPGPWIYSMYALNYAMHSFYGEMGRSWSAATPRELASAHPAPATGVPPHPLYLIGIWSLAHRHITLSNPRPSAHTSMDPLRRSCSSSSSSSSYDFII
jgi:hypothetical protein